MGGFVSNRSQQSKHHFPQSLTANWLRASKKYSKTYNHQRSSTVYFIKISPWCSTDAQILTVERKDIFTVIHTKRKNDPKKTENKENKMLEEKMSSAERVPKGKA